MVSTPMSEPITLRADDDSLTTLRDHWFFLLVRIMNEPLAIDLLPPLQAFGAQWDAVAAQEQLLEDDLTKADAAAVAKDRVLDVLSDQVTVGIHGSKKVDITLPEHKLYYGSKTPSRAKIPVLGPQLAMMGPWPQLLDEATKPALHVLATPAKKAVAEGVAAEQAITDAATASKKFKLDGERRQLFDSYNSLASTTYGALRAIVHDHPELALGLDWPDSFFRHRQRGRAPKTVAQAEVPLKAAQKALDAAKKVYDELVEAEKAAEQAEAEEAAAQLALDQAKKESEEAAAKQKAAEDKLKDAQKKPKKK
jgi:hypothetical protein